MAAPALMSQAKEDVMKRIELQAIWLSLFYFAVFAALLQS